MQLTEKCIDDVCMCVEVGLIHIDMWDIERKRTRETKPNWESNEHKPITTAS